MMTCNHVRVVLILAKSMAACQSSPSSAPPPQASVVSSIAGLGIAAYYPERRTLYLYSVGPEQQVTRCVSWRLEGPEHWPISHPCEATAPPPPARKTVP